MATEFLTAGDDPAQPDSDEKFEGLCQALLDLNDIASLERLRAAAPTPEEQQGIDQVIVLLKKNRGVQNG
jgi:hypothetical protein